MVRVHTAATFTVPDWQGGVQQFRLSLAWKICFSRRLTQLMMRRRSIGVLNVVEGRASSAARMLVTMALLGALADQCSCRRGGSNR